MTGPASTGWPEWRKRIFKHLVDFLDTLFTVISAVCVTGLVVVDTGTFFAPLEQVIIMLLIFFGSPGFMTMTTLILIFLGRRISLLWLSVPTTP